MKRPSRRTLYWLLAAWGILVVYRAARGVAWRDRALTISDEEAVEQRDEAP